MAATSGAASIRAPHGEQHFAAHELAGDDGNQGHAATP
jgi:hypothetical protein